MDGNSKALSTQPAGMRDPEGILGDGPTRFTTALDALEDVFYVFDTDQRLVAWNDRFAEVTGYTDEELHGMAPADFVREQDRPAVADYVDRIDERGHGTHAVELRTSDGETIPYEFYSDELTDADGSLLGRVGLGRDVTIRTEYADELERQNERLAEFASVLAHDLRNPLAIARASLDIVAEDREDGPHLRNVREAHERIDRIITDVLELVRYGEPVSETETVDLPAMATDVWSDVERGTSALSVEGEATVRADPSLLRRLLSNLLRNAIEHGGTDVRVWVGPIPGGFFVADDGPGIPSADRDTVFDWQHSTKEEGLGTGLTSVQQVCAVHGWTIEIAESRAGGTRFEVTGVSAPG